MKQKTILDYMGGLALLIAFVASLLLSATRIGLVETLPGCGVGSGCDLVTKGVWGSIPAIGWPVSFIGLAWYLALFVNWLKGDCSRCLLWVVRFGAVGSLFFVIVMVGLDTFCKWCLVAHLCNWIFWGGCELNNRTLTHREPSRMRWGSFVSTFFLSSLLLGVADYVSQYKRAKLAEENATKIVEGASDQSTLALLEARHRIGSADAPVQVVMFTDYQCPDCKRFEQQISNILKTRNDVSVSIKHFPLCFDCNDNIGDFNLHPNACWAARASEAAGIIGGDQKWEKMHEWLFEQKGSFTNQSLPNALAVMGYNPAEFTQIMMGEETEKLVMQDADDGFALGVYYTPMIFINGVEYLWYYGGEDSLSNVIAGVADAVKRGDTKTVAPPNLDDKLIEDWRRGKERNVLQFDHASWLGDGDIEIVVWGEYQSAQTVELDQMVRAALKQYPNSRYAFRHYPIDKECNPVAKDFPKNYDGSCFIAKVVESVGVLGGEDARWAIHQWVIESPLRGNQGVLLAKAAEIADVDQTVIRDVMESIDVNGKIQKDVSSKVAAWRKGVPILIIDGRAVPRWKSESLPAQQLIQRILDELGGESSSR